MATIGEGREIEFVYEWKIKDFLSLPCKVNKFYKSPTFLFGGASWYLMIFPHGKTAFQTVTGLTVNATNYVGLYLRRNSSGSPINLDLTLGLKTVTEKIDPEIKFTHVFTKVEARGLVKFLQKSELLARKSELIISGDLTVFCKMKYLKSAEVTVQKSLKEISTQTEMETGDGSLCHDYKRVLLEGSHHDFTLRVGDREFHVHRDILKARSPVFWSMLDLDMKEKNSDSVDIPDCSPDAMEQFLLYIYSGKVETFDQSNMSGLYYIADKYDVRGLKQECRNFIKESLSLTNFCEVVQLAMNHCDSILLEKATEYFGANMLGIMRTVEWQAFMKQNSTVANEILMKSIEKSNNAK